MLHSTEFARAAQEAPPQRPPMARRALERVETLFDAAFTPACNPLYWLGALAWFFYWVVAVTGVYLYIFFDTGVQQAYESVEAITHAQWYAGGVMRSLHRYASDALVLVAVAHLLREWTLGRLRGARWFAWLTGIPLLWMVFAAGVSGYWLVWDELAQYVAVGETEWLDTLPLFGESIARNFLDESTLSSRFFTLLVFIHIAVPLFLLFAMWIHIQRLSQPKVNPPRRLAIGCFAALVVVSLARPAVSHEPANLDVMPAELALDWYYLFVLPIQDRYSGAALWVLVGGLTLLLAVAPWMPVHRRKKPAVVHLDNCNGCGRCVADCPFSAVTLRPRTDGTAFIQEAVVREDLCVSCGICVGACPTATPFRRRSNLVAGIELPALTPAGLRERVSTLCEGLHGDARTVVIGCEHGPAIEGLSGHDVATIRIPCIGMLPPAFLDLIVSRRLADGVMLSGCRDGDCYYRLGIEWTRQRIARERDPYLRERVPRERLAMCFSGLDRVEGLCAELGAFQERLRGLGPRATVRKRAEPTAPAIHTRGAIGDV